MSRASRYEAPRVIRRVPVEPGLIGAVALSDPLLVPSFAFAPKGDTVAAPYEAPGVVRRTPVDPALTGVVSSSDPAPPTFAFTARR